MAGYTREHMARLVRTGEFPFPPVRRRGSQKRYRDIPYLRQWCSERRDAKIIRAKMARQTSKLYRGRYWDHLLKFRNGALWMLRSGRLNDPREIDYTLSQIEFIVGEVILRLNSKKHALDLEADRLLRRRKGDNLGRPLRRD